MTATELAGELDVSTRTVLRDIEALSTAGVPVYADRGRYGGFSLLPGFRTELTGMTHDEALALLVVASGRGRDVLGLASPLASGMRKIIDALPEDHQATLDQTARRLLVEPAADLLSRRVVPEDLADGVMTEVRRAVLTGHRLRFDYAAPGATSRSRTVDPIGLVTVRGRTYLLATRDGEDRTYRLSRMACAEVLSEPADRPAPVDLDRIWAERTARFLSEGHLPVVLRVRSSRLEELVETARAVRAEEPESADWVRVDLSFDDLRHAVWAAWQLGEDVEVLSPDEVRRALHERARVVSDRHRPRE